jgi:putative oxidoreductase
VRRLYSTFAGGWPGTALLLMRVVLGASLLLRANSTLWSNPPVTTTIISAFLAGSGLLLIPGLWTPVVGTLVALLETWQIMTIAGDRWLRCRHVRTGSMVSRCSPVWVEARGTTAQNQPQLLKSSFINRKISGLKEAVSFPP